MGHQVTSITALDPLPSDTDVVIFGKALHPIEYLFHEATARNIPVLVDLCDHIFVPPEDGLLAHYGPILPQVRAFAVPTKTLAAEIKRYFPLPIPSLVVPDGIEAEFDKPNFAPGEVLRLTWFGYPNGLLNLVECADQLKALAAEFKIELSMVTMVDTPLTDLAKEALEDVKHRFIEWSPREVDAAIQQGDFVFLPSTPRQANVVKSPNRLIHSLARGRYVIANPLPSYQDFEPFAGIGVDYVASVRAALADPNATLKKIEEGQNYVQNKFSPSYIAERWLKAIKLVTG